MAAAVTDALLAIKNWTGAVELDETGDDQQEWCRKSQQTEADDYVKNSLCEFVDGAAAKTIGIE